MKKILATLLFFFTILTYSQVNFEEIDWDNEAIGFACSFGGTPTNPVVNATSLIKKPKYKRIRKLIYSEKPYEQFLGVLILEQFQKKNKLTISETDFKQIELLRKSKEKVAVCSGCTYWDELTIEQMLETKDPDGFYEIGVSWFNFYYNRL